MKQVHRWLTLPQLWPWKQNSFQAYLPLPFSVTECTYVVCCEILISLGHHLSSPKFWKFFLCKINRVMKYSSCLYLACLKSRMNYSIYYKSTVFILLGVFLLQLRALPLICGVTSDISLHRDCCSSRRERFLTSHAEATLIQGALFK